MRKKCWIAKCETVCCLLYAGFLTLFSLSACLFAFNLCSAEDNSRFISCSADKTVFLWDVTSGRTLRKFLKHTQRVNTVRFTKDGALAVSGSYDATVKIWDMRSSSFEAVQTLNEFKDSVTCLDISENEILAGCVDGCIRNYDIRMGKIFVDHMAHPVTSAKFSQDRNCILVSTLDSTVRLMEKDTGVMLNQYKGHKAENYRIESCLSSTDAFIISGSEDNNLCVWDLVDAKLKTRLTGHTAAVCSLSYHPKETMLVTGSHDGTIKVWN